MIARADAIVRGPVESVVALNPSDSYMRFHQVTVKTRNRITGRAGDKVCFVTTDQEPYIDLKHEGHDGLFFLVQSPFDFNRQTHDYFYSRCPMICKNVINLGAETASIISFDVKGLSQVEGSKVIVAKVKQYLGTLQRDKRS